MNFYKFSFSGPKEAQKKSLRNKSFRTKRSYSDRWYKDFCAYCQKSTLHGLKYVGDVKISYGERMCWLLCFCVSVACAGFFVSLIYINYNKNPVMITINPIPTSVAEIPFPALTICGSNKVKRSYARDVSSRNDSRPQRHFLIDYCEYPSKTEISKGIHKDLADWNTFLNYVLKASPSCEKLIRACFWKSVEIECAKWFNPTLTDSGLCCTFNEMPNSYIFRSPDNFNELSYTYPPLIEDWHQEGGYSGNTPDEVYPWRSLGSGSNLGLTLVLDCVLNDYFCASTSSTGFIVQLHNPLEIPIMSYNGKLYEPGKEYWNEIEAIIKETDTDLKSLPVTIRQFSWFSKFATRLTILIFAKTYTE